RQSELTAIREEDAEITMTDRAVGIRLQRVPPERLRVAPDLNLLGAQVGQTAEPDDAERGPGLGERRSDRAGRPGLHRCAGGGAGREGEGEGGEIGVASVG